MDIEGEELLENEDLRERMLNDRNTEVLDKVKDIVWLGEDEVVTINQVVDFYEVGQLLHLNQKQDLDGA